jgi:hypothetical protein
MLRQYKFKILYTLGKDNGRADALSQRSNLTGTKTINEHAILRINQDSTLGLAQQLNNIFKVINKERLKLQVLEELQEAIICEYYNNLLHSHPGITRTIELIQRQY